MERRKRTSAESDRQADVTICLQFVNATSRNALARPLRKRNEIKLNRHFTTKIGSGISNRLPKFKPDRKGESLVNTCVLIYAGVRAAAHHPRVKHLRRKKRTLLGELATYRKHFQDSGHFQLACCSDRSHSKARAISTKKHTQYASDA
ncbi:hypothetical protein KIN20_013078 [Parelaphostrongylus tenuis]|uniref:Uncharacterized protein n=1 Tax=Parelaphostrongylus tenuis TaxID=148309 RepID=A0AAD5MU72_PARTN|nr:hypothetical protein KIN20_013078 [Parelaphostrongylus tenuis]